MVVSAREDTTKCVPVVQDSRDQDVNMVSHVSITIINHIQQEQGSDSLDSIHYQKHNGFLTICGVSINSMSLVLWEFCMCRCGNISNDTQRSSSNIIDSAFTDTTWWYTSLYFHINYTVVYPYISFITVAIWSDKCSLIYITSTS